MDKERLAYFKSRIEHGVPGLTIDEQIELWEIASGEEIEQRKRCAWCDGDGLMVASGCFAECWKCDGRGYTQ